MKRKYIFNNLQSKPRKKKCFGITRLLTHIISFSHRRTNKLAHVLKLTEVMFLVMQKFYDNGLISKIVILYFRLWVHRESPFGSYHRIGYPSASPFNRLSSHVYAYSTKLQRPFFQKRKTRENKRHVNKKFNNESSTFIETLPAHENTIYFLWKATNKIKEPIKLIPAIRKADNRWARSIEE